jgi:hypothetical protein
MWPPRVNSVRGGGKAIKFLEFHMADKPGHYNLDYKNAKNNTPQILSGRQLADFYADLAAKYPSTTKCNLLPLMHFSRFN